MRRWVWIAVTVVVGIPLMTAAWLFLRYRPRGVREAPAAVEAEIILRTAERDSLRAMIFAAAERSELLARRPEGDVLIGLPTPFVNALVQDVVAGWFHDVELTLRGIHIAKAGEVKARLGILGRRQVGTYDLDIVLEEVHGRLQPGAPTLTFGGDVIGISLPFSVVNGTIDASIAVAWESKGLAGPICGDLAATRRVHGTVLPADYTARGRLVLSALEGTVVADPEFPALALRLFPEPAQASLAVLDDLLEKKGGLCGIAVGKARVGDRIRVLVARGFNVKVPQKLFRPLRLPISVETAVPVQDRSVSLAVRPSGLAVTAATVWIAADVTIAPRATTLPR